MTHMDLKKRLQTTILVNFMAHSHICADLPNVWLLSGLNGRAGSGEEIFWASRTWKIHCPPLWEKVCRPPGTQSWSPYSPEISAPRGLLPQQGWLNCSQCRGNVMSKGSPGGGTRAAAGPWGRNEPLFSAACLPPSSAPAWAT